MREIIFTRSAQWNVCFPEILKLSLKDLMILSFKIAHSKRNQLCPVEGSFEFFAFAYQKMIPILF